MNVIAVDVGTTSVRLAIIAFLGPNKTNVEILASHEKQISHQQNGVKFEQNSNEIWKAICECCENCLSKCNIEPRFINGIAFSATCSLVIDNANQNALENNIIMWMDHRAIEEAETISKSESKVLEQFGGVCSPEFSLSKLMWLKSNAPERLESARGLFELPDWLVYKCIGFEDNVAASAQSLCCVTCKWGYDVENNQHCEFIQSTLCSKATSANNKFGQNVLAPGTVSGQLCRQAALDLGLIDLKSNNQFVPKIIVGTSLIDAHSGMLAMLSSPLKLNIDTTFCSLAGTSTCNMILSKQKNFIRGIWGPYKNVVINDYYLLEAGQSITGKLINMLFESHEESEYLLKNGAKFEDIVNRLNEQIVAMSDFGELESASRLHILPTYHGNRSPLANARLKGGVYGLTAERQASLLEYYIATVQATIYETKMIVETLATNLDTMLVSGGLMKNSFFMQTLADVLRCQVVRMALNEVDFMVMGSGLVARQAVLNESKFGINNPGKPLDEESLKNINYSQLTTHTFKPRAHTFGYHDKKYSCYKQFVKFSQRVDEILNRD